VLLTAALVVGFGFLIAASYQPRLSEFLAERLPRGVAAILKTEGSLLLASGVQGYIAIGFRHPLFLVVLSAIAIATASGALAREIERRTILLLLARPLPRYQLVLSKGLESGLSLLALVVAMLVGVFIGLAAQGLTGQVQAQALLFIGVNTLSLGLAIMGYSYLFSALSSDGGRATLLSTALTVLFFFADFISGLFDVLEPLGRISIFHYHDPVAVAVEASFPVLGVGILLCFAAVTFTAALVIFQRRDIAA
jgi:ABC-type transport system involved in multi-copper enzyme maturation permease subunit